MSNCNGIIAGHAVKNGISHSVAHENFYKMQISSKRTSGYVDTINCIVPEILYDRISDDSDVKVLCELRSRNYVGYDEKHHTEIVAFVTGIGDYERDINEFEVTGFICKMPTYRETPRGRRISDALVAINRVNSAKSDYIPCIMWGRNAMRSNQCLYVGSHVSISGRFQSREYTKIHEDGNEERKITYELSVAVLNVLEEEE